MKKTVWECDRCGYEIHGGDRQPADWVAITAVTDTKSEVSRLWCGGCWEEIKRRRQIEKVDKSI